MDSFEFEYGRVLENVDVHYLTYGNPKYDDEGFITNAILFFPTFNGIYSFLRGTHEYIMETNKFNDEFYFIVIHSLGAPDSCSPSTTGLNYNFPKYTCNDVVNFKRQFLAEKFKIKKILGLIGEGIGGYQVLTWACEYPDEMDFIILVNSAARVSGYKFLLGKTFDLMMDSVDDFYSEGYSVSKNNCVNAINTLLFAHSASKNVFENLDNYEISAFHDDFIDECYFRDIYDFRFRNDCDMEFDVVDQLQDIKAKSLFIGSNDNYFNHELDLIPFKEHVDGAVIVAQKIPQEDYFFKQEDYGSIIDELILFLNQFV